MKDDKVAAEAQLNVQLQEATRVGQLVVQVTDDRDPPQPIAGAQVSVIDGTSVTGTTNADGEVTLGVSFGGMEVFTTKDVTVTVTPPNGYTLSERSTQKVTVIAVGTIDVNLVLKPSSPGLRTLQVVPAGPGSGTVTSDMGGINCAVSTGATSGTCTTMVPQGQRVTLSATPTPETATFAGWSGGNCSDTQPCTVTMDQDRTIIATFGPEVHTLQIVLVGRGSGTVTVNPPDPPENTCDANCFFEEYRSGTQVTLTATPNETSSFAGWSGVPGVPDCSADGSEDTCTVTMDQSRTIFATFGEVHTLQIELSGSGSGTVNSDPKGISCGEDCDEVYPNDTQVTLTATPVPGSGSVFSGWRGSGCSGSNPQCILTMDQDHTVTATFTLQSFVLQVTLAGNGSGTVASDLPGITCGADCSKAYSSGTQVTLTADPGGSSSFAGWSGAPGCAADGSNDTCIVNMTQNREVTATFTTTPFLTARCRELLVGPTCGTSAFGCISLRIPVGGICQGACADAVAASLRAEGITVLGPSANLPAGFPPACVGFRPDIGGTTEGAQCLVDFLGPTYHLEDLNNPNCRVDGFPYNVYLE